MAAKRRRLNSRPATPFEPAAGNGLIHRRALLGGGVAFAGAMSAGVGTAVTSAAAEPLKDDPWSLEMGSVVPAYQVPSRFEKDVIRTRSNPNNDFRNSHARTPHHLLQGTVTPNGLFFTISHSGLPDIDPAQHKLVIHGLVKQPLVYTVERPPPRRCMGWCPTPNGPGFSCLRCWRKPALTRRPNGSSPKVPIPWRCIAAYR